MLFVSHKHTHGYTHLVGVDYSEPSIKLATLIAADQGKNNEISYYTLDLLSPEDVERFLKEVQIDAAADKEDGKAELFELALDKGTFDAISLASGAVVKEEDSEDEDDDEEGSEREKLPTPAQPASEEFRKNLMSRYAAAVASMLTDEGILLITSCNWTEKELVEGFGECK
jgi:hypothetical protein